MNVIFHITQREKWESAKLIGSYSADSLSTEGFIHCSRLPQIVRSANKFFANQKDLVILHIDSEKVKPEIRYEVASDGDSFPHIYGQLNVDAVFKVVDFEAGNDGLFVLPEEIAQT